MKRSRSIPYMLLTCKTSVKQGGSNELVKSSSACLAEKKSEAAEYKNKRQKITSRLETLHKLNKKSFDSNKSELIVFVSQWLRPLKMYAGSDIDPITVSIIRLGG